VPETIESSLLLLRPPVTLLVDPATAAGPTRSGGLLTCQRLAQSDAHDPQQKWSVCKPETFSDNLLMRIPQAANRFRLPDRCDLSQPVGFRNEITIHHGGAMLGKHDKVGAGFDQRHRRAAAAHRV